MAIRNRWLMFLNAWGPPGGRHAPFPEQMWPSVKDGSPRLLSHRLAWAGTVRETIYFSVFTLGTLGVILMGIVLLLGSQGVLALIAAVTIAIMLVGAAGMGVMRLQERAERQRFAAAPVAYNLTLMGGAGRLPAPYVAQLLKDHPSSLEGWVAAKGMGGAELEAFEAMAGEWAASTDDLVAACRAL